MVTCDSCKEPLDSETESTIDEIVKLLSLKTDYMPCSLMDIIEEDYLKKHGIWDEESYGEGTIRNIVKTFGLNAASDKLFEAMVDEAGGESELLRATIEMYTDSDDHTSAEVTALLERAKTDNTLAKRITWLRMKDLAEYFSGEY